MASNVTSGPSATNNQNVWANHIKNGDDRTHVPPMSKKVLILRIVQLVIAVIFLVLAAFAAFTLNMGNVMLTLATPCLISIIEGLTNIFWLATWASLASLASALNVARAGYYYVISARQAGFSPPPPPPDCGPDGRAPGCNGAGAGIGAGAGAGAGGVPAGGAGAGSAAASAAATARATIQAAKVAICVDAGLGALIWVLFIITLIATSEFALSIYTMFSFAAQILTLRVGMAIISHRKNNNSAKKGKGPEVAEV
ncbi:hypothetical protein PG996_012434 [Apiospora saccharicola]|uniref:Uncharacterized protein n=1 Tax=Apiospora saccharicola TaxID=335842 RepID=A0ABR1U5B7_9PEZI